MLALACFILVLVSTVISLLLYATSHGDSSLAFPFISKSKMLPPFADLRWITANSECAVDLSKLATGMAWGCDPYGRGGNLPYPPFSVEFARFLAVQGHHTSFLAFAWGLALVSIMVILGLRKIGCCGYSYMVLALLISGFPMQLALERANIDVGVFLLITSLSVFLAIDSFAVSILAAIITWIVVAAKAFPLVGILAWISLGSIEDIKVRKMTRLFVVGGLIAGVSSIFSWAMNSGDDIPRPEIDTFSHGLLVHGSSRLFWKLLNLLQTLNLPVSLVASLRLLPIVAISFFVLGLLLGLRKNSGINLRGEFAKGLETFEGRFLYHFVRITGLVWLGCYILTSNYDYRLIFAYPSFIYIAYWCVLRFKSDQDVWVASLLFIGLVLTSWGPLPTYSALFSSDFTGTWLSFIGDVFFLPLLAGFIASFCLPLRLLIQFDRDSRVS